MAAGPAEARDFRMLLRHLANFSEADEELERSLDEELEQTLQLTPTSFEGSKESPG